MPLFRKLEKEAINVNQYIKTKLFTSVGENLRANRTPTVFGNIICLNFSIFALVCQEFFRREL